MFCLWLKDSQPCWTFLCRSEWTEENSQKDYQGQEGTQHWKRSWLQIKSGGHGHPDVTWTRPEVQRQSQENQNLDMHSFLHSSVSSLWKVLYVLYTLVCYTVMVYADVWLHCKNKEKLNWPAFVFVQTSGVKIELQLWHHRWIMSQKKYGVVRRVWL